MCGIAGKLIFNNARNVSKDEIAAMTQCIRHRGPDDEGIFLDHSVALGHRRLSIIDLSPRGHQPMSERSGRYTIVFNGEIYNFKDLKTELERDGVVFLSDSDTEVILYLYEKYGSDCLPKLRGMFAFAIWDTKKRELFIARDRVGKKPIKYFVSEKCFIFASELKAILADSSVEKRIDMDALSDYLSFGYVPSPKTGFENVYKLEPAHYMLIKNNGAIEKRRYWDVVFSKKLVVTQEEWEQKIESKILEAVKVRLVSDVPLGAHLSGGIDSSLVVALMATLSDRPVQTYSIGFTEASHNELPYAKLVAERYKTNHTEIIVEPNTLQVLPKIAYHYEEPFADNSALPTWYLNEFTKKGITVALNGDGGDEVFGGYTRYQGMALYSLLQNIPGTSLVAYAARLGNGKFAKILQTLSKTSAEAYFDITSVFSNEEKIFLLPEAKLSKPKPQLQTLPHVEMLDSVLYAGLTTHLPDDLIPKVDIASMAHGVEVRSPLLDHELIELTAQMPRSLKYTWKNKKILLKKIAAKYLPDECINRPKQGFDLPLHSWLSGTAASNFLRDTLLDEHFVNLGFTKKYLTDIINQKSHFAGKKKWTLLMLALWHKTFFLYDH